MEKYFNEILNYGTLYGDMMLENSKVVMICTFCGKPMPYRMDYTGRHKKYLSCTCRPSRDAAIRRRVAAAKQIGFVVCVGSKNRYALTPNEILSILSGMPVGYTDRDQLERWGEEKGLILRVVKALEQSNLGNLLKAAEFYKDLASGRNLSGWESANIADRILHHSHTLPTLLVF